MKKTIIFAVMVSLFISCKKDKDNNKTCNQDMAGISGTYKNTAVAYKANPAAPEQDYYNQYYPDACERDDLYILKADGSFTYKDAGVQCLPAGDDSGNWSVSGNAGTYDGYAVTIQSFTCSTLVILLLDVSGNGSGDQLKLTFTRQ